MSTTQLRGTIGRAFVSNRRVIFVESVVALLLVWELSARIFGITDLIASPILVGGGIYELLSGDEWVMHFVASMQRILLGFGAALVVGIIGGVVLGVSNFWGKVLRYYVLVGMAVPGLFVVIFTAMAFGISDTTPMLATAVITAPFVVDIIQSGVENVESDLLNMSSAFGVSRSRVYRRVLFQSILPEIFSAIRFTFSVAWKVTILAEVVISNVGIGFLIADNMSRFSMVGVLQYVVLFVILMMVIEYGIFSKMEEYLFSWREDIKSSMGTGPR
ncbi:ABC transporter permease [Halobellus captivus]|uniref:ABC transporter permease n=1 Tax=Halobellus captivus TaxID=2592614 RepID=UPI00119DF6F4|nr:ABC transporter permease subunit [Halobellus captivus]